MQRFVTHTRLIYSGCIHNYSLMTLEYDAIPATTENAIVSPSFAAETPRSIYVSSEWKHQDRFQVTSSYHICTG